MALPRRVKKLIWLLGLMFDGGRRPDRSLDSATHTLAA